MTNSHLRIASGSMIIVGAFLMSLSVSGLAGAVGVGLVFMGGGWTVLAGVLDHYDDGE